MATFDLTPFYHATVGFDRISSLLADALERDETGFPPYNIEKTGDDAYRVVMALAGFSKDDLEIVTENNRLLIRGELRNKTEQSYLHQGIAHRAFQRVFDLADYVVVTGASMNDGLLMIDLKRELGVHVPAVVAGGVRKLGVAALGAAHVVDRLEGLMSPALALARLGMFLDRKHDCNSMCYQKLLAKRYLTPKK